LTPASGCQDHTTSPSASRALVFGAACVHRLPRPTSVAIRPTCGCGITKDGEVICGRGKPKYFCKRGWTHNSVICLSAQKLVGSLPPDRDACALHCLRADCSLPLASKALMGVVEALNIRIGTPVESTASLSLTAPAASKKTMPGLEP
jgi:hypothetical protein